MVIVGVYVEEVKGAVCWMHRGRAIGSDEISVNFWKSTGGVDIKLVTELFNIIFRTTKMLKTCRWSMMIPLYKNKGYIRSCNSYRDIKLLTHTMNFWERVVELRLRRIVTF